MTKSNYDPVSEELKPNTASTAIFKWPDINISKPPKRIHIIVSSSAEHTLKLETDNTIFLLVNQQTAEQLKRQIIIQDIEHTKGATLTLCADISFTYP